MKISMTSSNRFHVRRMINRVRSTNSKIKHFMTEIDLYQFSIFSHTTTYVSGKKERHFIATKKFSVHSKQR